MAKPKSRGKYKPSDYGFPEKLGRKRSVEVEGLKYRVLEATHGKTKAEIVIYRKDGLRYRDGKLVCCGHIRRNREDPKLPPPLCKKFAWTHTGYDICDLHGAKSLRGANHPSTTTGKGSKFRYQVKGLVRNALEGVLDAEGRSLDSETAVARAIVQARLTELEEADEGKPTAEIFEELGRDASALQEAINEGSSVRMQRYLTSVLRTIREGSKKEIAKRNLTRELRSNLDTLRKIVETQGKSELAEKKYLTEEEFAIEAMRFVSAARSMVKRVALRIEKGEDPDRVVRAERSQFSKVIFEEGPKELVDITPNASA